jgi:hypothetical protein
MVAGLALIAAACTAAHPTPIYLYTTVPSPSDTATPEDTATLTPDSGAPTDTSAGQSALPTPVVSVPPTASPSPSPTSLGGGCSGTAPNQAWWAAEAKVLKFTVYCGHVPSGWHFTKVVDTYAHGGTLVATYSGPSGGVVTIKEGAFCTAGGSACSPHDTYVGAANFGNLSGGLYTLGPGLGYAIYVAAGTTHGYTATGTKVSQATFVKIAAALYLVPKTAT